MPKKVRKATVPPPPPASEMFGSGVGPEAPKIEFDPMIQLGRSGLKQYAGFIQEDPLQNLRGQKAAQAFREILEGSALVGGIDRLIKLSMRQVSKFVTPYGGTDADAQDEERAERIEQALDDMSYSWEDTMSSVCSMIGYGFAPMELVYKKCSGWSEDPTKRSRFDDGLIMWRKVSLRSQDSVFRWDFDSEGGVRALIQLPPPDFTMRTIPIEKLLLFRPEIGKENPEGQSVLRCGYVNWLMVKRLTEFEAIKGERDASGLPVAFIPAKNMGPSATASETAVFTAMKKVVQNIRVNDQGGVVMPQAYDPITKQPLFSLELLGAKGQNGTTSFDYDKVITRHEVRLAMAMLADVAMLGHEKAGSWALARDKRTMLQAGLGAWLDSIYGVWNRHALPRVWALNGWPMDRMCTIGHGEIQATDMEALATAAQKLAAAGMELFPDDPLENHIRAEFGWPEKQFETPPELWDPNDPGWQERHQPPQLDGEDPNAQDASGAADEKPPKGKGVPTRKAKHQPRTTRGKYQPRSGAVVGALQILRERRAIGPNDRVQHGFKVADPIPFDPKTMSQTMNLEHAALERVPLGSLIATQPDVKRETVRNFIDNPQTVVPGQRSITGQLLDRPVVIRHKGDHYIADGHHRLAAKLLLGYEDAVVRVVPDPADQGEPHRV